MIPQKFPESTKELGPPPSMPEVQRLPVWTDGEQCVSCWRPTWRERLSVLVFGRVWLAVWSGSTQPPVCATGRRRYFHVALPQTLRVAEK